MTTINLQPALLQQLEQIAADQNANPEQLVEAAVRAYLRQIDRARIKTEVEAYHAMHPELTKKYLDQYVAIYNRQLVDADPDFQNLHTRVRQRFGRQPVLIRHVETKPERELTFRSPQLEKMPR